MYHPHLAPSSTFPATLLEASSTVHQYIPPALRFAPAYRSPRQPAEAVPSAFQSFASLLSVPPIHVDAVGEAVCRSIAAPEVDGVVDVARMRQMLGFDPAAPPYAAADGRAL